MVRALGQTPQIRAGVGRPGVREERDVEVVGVLRCRSGAFLRIWKLIFGFSERRCEGDLQLMKRLKMLFLLETALGLNGHA